MGEYKIIQQSDYFLLNFSGQIELSTVMASYSALLQLPGFVSESHSIWNFEESMLNLSISDIHQLADGVTASAGRRSNDAKSAFVVSDPSDTVTLENYITLTSHYPVEFELFSNLRSAEKWIRTEP